MKPELDQAVAKQVLITIICDNNMNSIFARDDEDKPFVIVESWKELGKIQRLLNKQLNFWNYQRWYKTLEQIYGEKAFQDLRYRTDKDSFPPFEIIDDLIGLDDIAGWGFSDEYATCDNCGVVIRTSPDSYGWQPNFWRTEDGERLCLSCAKRDFEDKYVQDYVSRQKMLNLDLVDISEKGWVELDLKFENGLHRGQNDDPKKILKLLEDFEIIFTGSVGQFDVNFSVWTKPEDAEKARKILER